MKYTSMHICTEMGVERNCEKQNPRGRTSWYFSGQGQGPPASRGRTHSVQCCGRSVPGLFSKPQNTQRGGGPLPAPPPPPDQVSTGTRASFTTSLALFNAPLFPPSLYSNSFSHRPCWKSSFAEHVSQGFCSPLTPQREQGQRTVCASLTTTWGKSLPRRKGGQRRRAASPVALEPRERRADGPAAWEAQEKIRP